VCSVTTAVVVVTSALLRLLAIAAVLAGCGARDGNSPAVPPTGARPALDVELTFQGPKGPITVPIARVRIGEETTWWMVDTGADVHAIDHSVATQLGLPLRTVQIEDKTITLADITLVLDGAGGGFAVPQREILVVDFPAHVGLAASGVSGVLAPQLLATEGQSITLDLPARRMTTVPRPRTGDDHVVAKVRYCDTAQGGIQGRRLLFDGLLAADGGSPKLVVVLKPNTGRERTVLFENRDQVNLALGTFSEDATAAVLYVGKARAAGEMLLGIGPEERGLCEAFDGLLSLDVLGRCMIALAADAGEITCPSTPSR
jgi:hypothetical protein